MFVKILFDKKRFMQDKSYVFLRVLPMYPTLPHLQSAVRTALEKGQFFRVYPESLNAIWPNIPDDVRAAKLAHFAAQHRWQVELRSLPGLGVVAEFQKAGKPVAT